MKSNKLFLSIENCSGEYCSHFFDFSTFSSFNFMQVMLLLCTDSEGRFKVSRLIQNTMSIETTVPKQIVQIGNKWVSLGFSVKIEMILSKTERMKTEGRLFFSWTGKWNVCYLAFISWTRAVKGTSNALIIPLLRNIAQRCEAVSLSKYKSPKDLRCIWGS